MRQSKRRGMRVQTGSQNTCGPFAWIATSAIPYDESDQLLLVDGGELAALGRCHPEMV